MSLASQAAYDAQAVLCNPADFGEPARHVAQDGTPTDVVAVFFAQALEDLGQGFVADAARVLIPRRDVRRVRRGDQLVRYPGAVESLVGEDGWALLDEGGAELGLETSGEQAWLVDAVQEDVGLWACRCVHQPRPVPRR